MRGAARTALHIGRLVGSGKLRGNCRVATPILDKQGVMPNRYRSKTILHPTKLGKLEPDRS